MVDSNCPCFSTVMKFISISAIAFALILGIATYSIANAIEKKNLPEETKEKRGLSLPSIICKHINVLFYFLAFGSLM